MSLMDVGNPTSNPVRQNIDKQERLNQIIDELDAAKFRYVLWIAGMVIGLLPAMAIPFAKIVGGNVSSLCEFITATFCQSEILFMAVSLSISANNDATAHNERSFNKWWGLIAIILILVGALTFAILSFMEYLEFEISESATTVFSLILFVATLAGCSAPYIKAIKNIKAEMKMIQNEG